MIFLPFCVCFMRVKETMLYFNRWWVICCVAVYACLMIRIGADMLLNHAVLTCAFWELLDAVANEWKVRLGRKGIFWRSLTLHNFWMNYKWSPYRSTKTRSWKYAFWPKNQQWSVCFEMVLCLYDFPILQGLKESTSRTL